MPSVAPFTLLLCLFVVPSPPFPNPSELKRGGISSPQRGAPVAEGPPEGCSGPLGAKFVCSH